MQQKPDTGAHDAFAEVFARSQTAQDSSAASTQAAITTQQPLPPPDPSPVRVDDNRNDQPWRNDDLPAPAAASAPAADAPKEAEPGAPPPPAHERNGTHSRRSGTERAGASRTDARDTDDTRTDKTANAAGDADGKVDDEKNASQPVGKAGAREKGKADDKAAQALKAADEDAGDLVVNAAAVAGQLAAPDAAKLVAPGVTLQIAGKAELLGQGVEGAVGNAGISGGLTLDPAKAALAGEGGAPGLGQPASLFLSLVLKAGAGKAKEATPAEANDAEIASISPAGATPPPPDTAAKLASALGLKPAVASAPTAASETEPGLKALGAALKSITATPGNAAIQLPSGLTALSADPLAAPDAAQPAPTLATTLAALPVAIGSRALNGVREFTIHLYPAELGKVEVKLSVGDAGDIKANLTVDRVETLQLLQRDASQLHQALEQAGFKPGENSLQFSLRQDSGQASSQRQGGDASNQRPSWTPHAPDADATPVRDVTLQALAAYQRRGAGALDIHV